MPTKFILIGSGLAGGLLGAYLGRRGYDVDLYERRADPREGNIVGGRSINLAVSTRGIHALEQLSIANEVLKHAIPMRGRMIHPATAGRAPIFVRYDVDPTKCINSIGRAALNTTVIDAAQRYANVRVHFNHRCTDVDLTEAVCYLETENGQVIKARGDAVIGVDGAFSAVRQSMQKKIENFKYDELSAHGYKELTIPPGPDGSWQMEKEALHIWPRKSFMMIALPNPDGSFTCTLFWEFEGPRSFATTKTDDDVRRFFDEEFPDAVPLMPTLLDDFRQNPTGSLVTIRCLPWFHKDKVALVVTLPTVCPSTAREGTPRSKSASCSTNASPNSRTTGSAHSRSTLCGEKRTRTRSPISPFRTSSRCAIKPHRKHFEQRKNSITSSKLCCRACICLFMRW
jgi:kynurenine 3-monooxygenase